MRERSTNNRKGNKIKYLGDQWDVKVNVTGQSVQSNHFKPLQELSKTHLLAQQMGSKFLIPITTRSSFSLSAMINGIPFWFLKGQTRHENSLIVLYEKDTNIPYFLEYSKWHIPYSNGHCHKSCTSHIPCMKNLWIAVSKQKKKSGKIPENSIF